MRLRGGSRWHGAAVDSGDMWVSNGCTMMKIIVAAELQLVVLVVPAWAAFEWSVIILGR